MQTKSQNILEIIDSFTAQATRQQLNIAAYLLDNHQKAALLSVTQLAKEIGVSQPTLTRFVQALGFSKYQLFQEVFQELLLAELTSAGRFALGLDSKRSICYGPSDIITREIRTLTDFARAFPQKDLDQAVAKISQSDRVYIMGTGSSAALAQHFGYFLSKVKTNIFTVTNGSTNDYGRLMHLNSKDVVVAISFYRYGRETIEMVQFCHDRGVGLIAITDDAASPIATLAESTIFVPVTYGPLFDSLCSVFCLFNMMATKISRINRTESAILFDKFEELARKINIFSEAGSRRLSKP
jgi:DNA-binding MurR/RpiR family transcriptional regulator